MKKSSIFPNPLPALEAAVIGLVTPALTNIQNALITISQNPGNNMIFIEQEAVIVANVNTLIADAPAALPILQSVAISQGAADGALLIGKLIAYLQAQTASSAGGTS